MARDRREYQRQWAHANRDKRREYQRRQREKNGDKIRERNRKWQAAHPEATRATHPVHGPKVRARSLLLLARLRGDIIKPHHCSICGEEREQRLIHAHHDDYSKPLEIIWCCAMCHIGLHPEKRKENAVGEWQLQRSPKGK